MAAVRKAVWTSDGPANGWTSDLTWYAAAIHRMKELTPGLDAFRPLALRILDLEGASQVRPLTSAEKAELRDKLGAVKDILAGWSDPRSLGYQSQVHATFLRPQDWPSFQGTPVLWSECAHGNWFFLPWHRAYLLEFESVVRAHIKELHGPHEEWALPYWNSSDYATLPEAADLPLPLRGSHLPAGVVVEGVAPAGPNPLHEPSRLLTGASDLEGPPSADAWPDASDALSRHHYATADGSNRVSFGGGYLEDLSRFHFSGELGQLDGQPHGLGHTTVNGLMGAFETAGLDPVFWMHHANIDRLWETYADDLGHGYPFPDGRPPGGKAAQAFDSWSSRAFRFLRPDRSEKTWTAPKVLNVGALGYSYDTTAKPVLLPTSSDPTGQDIEPFGLDVGLSTPVSAATDVAVGASTRVRLRGGDGNGAGLADPGVAWHVRFDGLRCARPALTYYRVFLAEHLIGVLPLFGVFESSRSESGELGQSRVLDATGAVAAMPDLDPLDVEVRLEPANPDRAVETVGLTVDRVTLEVG
jgi:tyrosinase